MLSQRLKVALPLIFVVFLVFFLPGLWGKLAFAALAAAIFLGANHEGVLLCGMKPFGKEEFLLDVFAALLLTGAFLGGAGNFALTFLLIVPFVFLAFFLAFFQKVTPESLHSVASLILIGLLIDVDLAFLSNLFYQPAGAMLLVYMVTCTKLADIGAYALGSLTAKLPGGNHKLSPYVSPKKSWEGLLGGILFSTGASLLFYHFSCISMLTAFSAVILGILMAVLGLLGDLCESYLKRAAGVKDSGKIPGLGGVLDIVDSLLPMGFLFFCWLFLVSLGI